MSPGDGETDVFTSATLEVTVTDAEGDPSDVTFYGRPVSGDPGGDPVPGEDFTIIAMPDTQHYTDGVGAASNFAAQTQWIVDNKDTRNIAFVTGLGDIVQNGDANDSEWQIADGAYSLLENPATTFLPDGIPYGLAVGNHDQSPSGGGDSASTAKYNEYFGVDRFDGRIYYGDHYGTNNDNHYELFTAGGMDFIAFHFEYDTTMQSEVLDWAETAIAAHPSRRIMVSMHYLMNIGSGASHSAQGQAIFNRLSSYENLFLMLGGHMHGEGQREDLGSNGNVVDSLLADYQDLPSGGNGWLRILEFSPANNEITVLTYSPVLNQYGTSTTMATNSTSAPFTLDYDMFTNGWTRIGADQNVESGTTASVTWADLDDFTEYEWYAVADGGSEITGPTWSFTTGDTEPPPTLNGFAAYNDLGWGDGQLTSNITRITSPDGGSGLPSTGELVDFDTGLGTGVNLSVTGGTFDAGQQADFYTAEPLPGTDAFEVFDGKLDALGTISYEQIAPPEGNLVLTLDSLDPSQSYEIVLYGHRGDYLLENRAALLTLTGADAFANESTAGSDFSGPDDPSTRMGPDNVEGYVARWTGVRAGSDGTVEIVVSYDGTVSGDEYKGKYANALALFEEGAGSVKFAAFGDYGYTPSPGLGEVADLVNAHEVDLIITTGDNSYDPSGIDANVGQFYSDWIGDYQGTYGPGADVNKFFPALGKS